MMSRSQFPKIDGLGFIQFFLENLKEMLSQNDNSVASMNLDEGGRKMDRSSSENFSFDVFGLWLEGIEFIESFVHIDAKDQICTLKMELRFLITFSKCIARDENLKISSIHAIDAHFDLFSFAEEVSDPKELMCLLSDVLLALVEMRSKVKYFYDLISVTSQSYIPMTNDLVVELINDLVQNLKDLLSSKANWMVTIKSQILVLKERLQFLRNFLDLLPKQRRKHEKIKDLLARSEALAIDAARTSYSCLVDQQTDESTREIEFELSNLVQKIKTLLAEVREMYISVLEATKTSESSAFLDSLHDLLLEILRSDSGLKLPVHHQLKKLDDKFGFIRAFLRYFPRRYTGPENLYHLWRSIEDLTIESGSFIFSLYIDEMTEDLDMQMNLVLVDLLEKAKYIKLKGEEIYRSPLKPSRPKFPKVDGLGFIQFLLENLGELLSHGDNSVALPKHFIETVQKEFESLVPLLKNMEGRLNQHEEFKSLWIKVIDLAYHAEYAIDSLVTKNGSVLWLDDILDEIQLVKADVIQINSQVPVDTGVHNVARHSSSAPSLAKSPTNDAQLVGFEDEVEKLTDRLINGPDQLDIVSVVGMPGLGKTTLCKKLYNSSSVEKHFHVRAWCSISQVYQKKDLLLSILSHVIELKGRHYEIDEDDLALLLMRRLMGNRYLIVMDDIWNIEAWHDLKLSFPDNANGSRIMLTTRILDVALQAKLHSDPYSPRPFNDEESWDLLQVLLFPEESCPLEIWDIGKQIAISCKGLPLSVVLIAGLLATDKTLEFWEEVAESFSSWIVDDEQTQTLDIIGLSYQHLPDHLKPCFLYFGAFLEDQEISVKKLIRLWTAEGFVRKAEGQRMEDTAEDFLRDLSSRSLITIAKLRADGGIKACRIHDILSHFCKAKAKEKNFWQLIDGYDYLCPSTPTCEQYRLCYSERNQFVKSRPSGSHVRSLHLFAARDGHQHNPSHISFVSNNFKLLRVLNLECLKLLGFPSELELLVQLKYLALWVMAAFVPSSIGYLRNLETFFMEVDVLFFMPEAIWNMSKLRHLHVSQLPASKGNIRELEFEETEFAPSSFQQQYLEDSNQLNNLQTISTLSFTNGRQEEILRKIPNIRKLSCVILDAADSSSNCCHFPALELLNKLESVKVLFAGSWLPPLWEIVFPLQLKKLTFAGFKLQWEEISIIGRLENLEVLKLRERAFEGPLWDMGVGEFPKLKHLEMYMIDLKEWNASCDNLPCLQRLRLLSCNYLKMVPSCLGEVETLGMIEVKWCPKLDVESIKKVEEEQRDQGNSDFKTFIKTGDEEDTDEDADEDADDESFLDGLVSAFF